jgi:WD40 repeat protein
MSFLRIKNDTALIRGHTGPVLDVKFSPHRPSLLATASDDSTVKLWDIPQGGVHEEGIVELQKFTGHSKKVGLLAFSPTVTELIASASFDNTINVWNILNATSYSKVSLGDNILSLDWNYNGSLLGATTKQKQVYVVDPRSGSILMQTAGHESGKTSKMGFLNENNLFSCGFGKTGERQIKLFDMRKFNECAQTCTVDTQNGIMLPTYDPDTGLIFIPGRGEGNIKYFEFSQGTIKYANEYRGMTQQKSGAFFPKRSMNYNKCEIARYAKLTNNTIEYVSFYVPKRNEGYDSSVYPDCLSGEASLGVEEWLKGTNKDPIRKNITTLENKWNVVSEMTFEKKVEEVKKSPEEEKVRFYFNFRSLS